MDNDSAVRCREDLCAALRARGEATDCAWRGAENGGAPCGKARSPRVLHFPEVHGSAMQIVVHESPASESPGVLVTMHPQIRLSGLRIWD